MRILFAIDNFDHDEGGAEKSSQVIAQMLAGAGHEVSVLQLGPARDPYVQAGATVHNRAVGRPLLFRDREMLVFWQNRRWEPILEEFLGRRSLDLILTQHRLSPATVRVARRRGIPVVTFVRAYGMLCPTQFLTLDALAGCDRRCFRCLSLRQKVKYPLVKAAVRSLGEAVKQSDVVIANSEYVRCVVERFLGVPSHVLYPPVDLAGVRVDRPSGDGRVLFAKPQAVKGLDVLEKVARAMPQERFLVAGKTGRRVQRRLGGLGNVESMGWVSDMRDAYRRTRVLLGPAAWPEPFGRVFVEAAASGIPAVASRAGGIPEAVGQGGLLVDDRDNTAAWVDALTALRDTVLYERLSREARAHAERFAPERALETFRSILSVSLGMAV